MTLHCKHNFISIRSGIYDTSFVSFIEDAFYYLATFLLFFIFLSCCFVYSTCSVLSPYCVWRWSRKRERENPRNMLYQDGASLKLSLFNWVVRAKRRHVAFCLIIHKQPKREKDSYDLAQSCVCSRMTRLFQRWKHEQRHLRNVKCVKVDKY